MSKRIKPNGDDFGFNAKQTQRKANKPRPCSGVSRSVDTIRSLSDLCIDKLMKQLHNLVITENLDYHRIKPLLNRCSALELQRLETLNPSLAFKTDLLWYELCQKQFLFTTHCDENNNKNECIDCVTNKISNENWRHFYWRSIDFRKRKLEDITSNIRQKNDFLKTSRRLTKVCDLEPISKKATKRKRQKAQPKAQPKASIIGPLMKKCLKMKK